MKLQLYKSEALLRLDRDEEACLLLDDFSLQSPTPHALMLLGCALIKLEKFEQALESLGRAETMHGADLVSIQQYKQKCMDALD